MTRVAKKAVSLYIALYRELFVDQCIFTVTKRAFEDVWQHSEHALASKHTLNTSHALSTVLYVMLIALSLIVGRMIRA